MSDRHAAGGQPVILDVSRLLWRAWLGHIPTGIDRSMLAYVAHYRGRARALVQRSGYTRILPLWLSRRLFDVLLNGAPIGRRLALSAILTASFYTPLARGTRGLPYLNVGHTGLDRPGHARWVRRMGVRPIYFVHDLIPITHPQYCRAGEDVRHAQRMRALLRLGVAVVANSDDTLDRLAEFADREGLAMPPHRVVALLGVEPFWEAARGAAAPQEDDRPYFLTLGTIEGRKNHILLLRIWRDLARELGDACPRLVIVGQRGWQCEDVTAVLDGCPELRGHVTEVARCGDAELVSLMAGARALLFPSFAEGYGLPLVEALALGTPVIASDLPVFAEIAGDVALRIDPNDGAAWDAAIRDYARPDSAARAAQMERLVASGFRVPEWDAHFRVVDRLVEAVAASAQPNGTISTG
ncbi:MAG: glycosyltransferase family 1 protein [Sphingobium sp.]